jgi:hypothetical protein
MTTNNYDSLTELHTLKITETTAHIVLSVFINRCLVAASNDGHSPSSGLLELSPASAVSFSLLTTAALSWLDWLLNASTLILGSESHGTHDLILPSDDSGSLQSNFSSDRELLYDWRFTTNQFVLAPNPTRPTTSIFFQLNTWCCSPYVTSSLKRGWICRLQLSLALASAVIFGSESGGIRDLILLFQNRNSPTLEGQVPEFIPQGTGWPSYTPRHWVLFLPPSTSVTATVKVFEPGSWNTCPHFTVPAWTAQKSSL